MEMPENAVHPNNRPAWRKWLEQNHTRGEGIWLVTYKKETGKPRMDYDESVEEALCFGWVDSKPAKLDDERSMLWFAPRKAGTGWSAKNKERIERLTQSGRMHPSGQAKVDASKADGSWNKLDAVERLEIPNDLAAALSEHPPASTEFEAFPRSVKRAILEWIGNAKKPETRSARIRETAEKAAKGERANQWRG